MRIFIKAEIQQEASVASGKGKYILEGIGGICQPAKTKGIVEGAMTEVLLSHFFNGEKRYVASSMWTRYSIPKLMLEVHKGIDISKYGKLTPYLKAGSRNYKPKKAKILERTQIKEFLKKAPDEEYLQLKDNAGGDIITVKHHDDWKSTMIAGSYKKESLSSKTVIAEKILVLPNIVGHCSPSETLYRVHLNNPGQNNKIVLEINVDVNIDNNSK